MITFRCTECRHKFKGMGFEWNATNRVAPLRCPHCGSIRTLPVESFMDIFLWNIGGSKCNPNYEIYEKIWKEIEKQ